MSARRDYYEVLGVARNATHDQIAAAYRKLAIRNHPDSNPGDAEATERFKEAAEAYEVLGDEEKRHRYDRYGHAGVDHTHAQFTDVEDIFEAFGDIFGGGFFGDVFGARRRRPRHGADIVCSVTLDLEEAASGVTKSVRFRRSQACEQCQGSGAAPGASREVCRRCGGRGQVVQSAGILRVQTACQSCGGAGYVISTPCSGCQGAGFVKRQQHRKVPIPPGVDDGNRIRLRGEGEPSPYGGPPGDCYCVVSIRPHKLFHRDGRNLILQLPITYSQAALGATIEVPTLAGRDRLEIPPGTQSGAVLRKRGRGMPGLNGAEGGDLLVQTFIETPTRLSPRQEELLRQLAELEHKDVTPHRQSFLEKLRTYFTGERAETESEEES